MDFAGEYHIMRTTDDTTRRHPSRTTDTHQATANAAPNGLRLVGDARTPQQVSSAHDARVRSDQHREKKRTLEDRQRWEATAQVTTENHAAAALSAFDARWVMAARVASQIQGGQAAILSPDRRARLITTAAHLGLRRFDANLIIAIVQDSARCGQEPLGTQTTDRLLLVAPAKTATSHKSPSPALLLVCSAVLAAAWAWLLLHWLVG